MVESRLPKPVVAGSSPVIRSRGGAFSAAFFVDLNSLYFVNKSKHLENVDIPSRIQ
jgi:hypothetical protein